MLAATVGELRFMVPPWGCVLLMLLGATYLIFGSYWPRFFDVLSMTVLGCLGGLVLSAWVPLAPALVIVIGGIVVGGLTAFFRNVAHAVLAATVLAAVFSAFAGLAVGPDGFGSYLVVNLSETTYSTAVSGPNLGNDPVLAAGITGLLVGATVAVVRFRQSERLVTAAQGAALLVFGLVKWVPAYRQAGTPSLASDFPLTLAALWLCLVAIGVVTQRALTGASAAEGEATGKRPRDDRHSEA